MGTKLIARRLSKIEVAAGTDVIQFGISLPANTIVTGVKAAVNLWGPSVVDVQRAVMYACEGWILPLLDAETALAYITLWDNLVPKDTDVETIDLDTGALDTTPFFEAGEPDFAELFDVGSDAKRIYHRHRVMSIVQGNYIKYQDNQTPFTPQYHPGEAFNINVNRSYRVTQPSALIFAIASPAMDDTTSSAPATLAEAEWAQVQYIDHVVERSLLHLFGVIETGAETPWEEATALLKKQLLPDVFEQVAGEWASVEYDVTTMATITMIVDGSLRKSTISIGEA